MSLNLVLSYEASALAAPQSFRDAMQTAANILDATIQDNITITIEVGYGDYFNNQITGLGTSAVGGDLYGSFVSYTSLRAALASHETSTLDQTFVNSLPTTSSVNGMSGFYVPSAVEKALGMISPTASAIDGAVGIGTGIPVGDLVGVALHELTHAMGREPGTGTFDLGRYTSPGNHLFSSGSTAPAAYFSIDGGVTVLANYGQNSDPSDFLNSGVQGSVDPFNEFYSGATSQVLSTVDIQQLDALGFNVTPSTAGTPSATTSSIVASSPTVTANGTSTTTLTVTVKDANGNAVAGTTVTLSASGSANSFGAISGTTNASGVFTTTLASTLAQNETITATEGSVHEQTSVSFVAGAPSATTSSLVASSPTVTADGSSTTTLTVTVKDANGNAVAGTAVTLSGSGSANSFGAISGTTNASGVFTTTLASTLVQNETITATEGSIHEQTSVSFVASAISATTSSLVASSPTVTADGASTTALTVTVKDAQGHAVAGTAVTLSGSGSANSFGAISGTTNASGVFTTTLASTLAQNETITATEGGVHEQTSVSFVAGAPSATTSSIVASSPTVTADGTSTTTLTVTVEDAHGNAVAGTAVTLSGSGSNNSFGAISGTTNASGVFTTTLASTQVQTETITATEGSVHEQASVSFVPPASMPTLSVSNDPTATHGQVLSLSNLVSISDPSGVGYQKLELWDSNGTAAGGQLVVNGIAQTGGHEIDVTPANVANTVFDVGTLGGTDTLWARLQENDGTLSNWQLFTVTAPQVSMPTLSVSNDPTAKQGQSVSLSNLVAISDPSGVGYQKLELWDSNGTAAGGQFVVNGVAQTGGHEIDVAPADVAHTVFNPGTAGGSDTLWARVLENDGTLSNWQAFSVTAPWPTLSTAHTPSATTNQVINVSSLFTISDPSGVGYQKLELWDSNGTVAGGQFVVNGVAQTGGHEIDVAPADVANTVFHTGTTIGTDTVWARLLENNGTLSNWQQLNVTAAPMPTLSVSNDPTATHGQIVSLSNLVTISDPGGVGYQKLELWDSSGTVAGGQLVVNGVAQTGGHEIDVAPADVAHTVFDVGTLGGTDTLWARLQENDGTLSNWQLFTVTAPQLSMPTVSVSNDPTATQGQIVSLSSLVTISDPSGVGYQKLELWDSNGTAAGGQFVVNGVAQTGGHEIDVTPANIANTVFDVGTSGGTDTLWARLQENDGSLTGWKMFTVATSAPAAVHASALLEVAGAASGTAKSGQDVQQDLNDVGVIRVAVPAVTSPVATDNVAIHFADNDAANAIFSMGRSDAFVFAPNLGQAATPNFALATSPIQFSEANLANTNALLAAIHNDGQGNAVIAGGMLAIEHFIAGQLQAHQHDFHII